MNYKLFLIGVLTIKFVNGLGECGSDIIKLDPIEPECLPERNEPICKTVELERESCPQLPCMGNMTLRLDIETENPTQGSCCKSCTCYGDPHCESFSGYKESWIICDARRILPNQPHCRMAKPICEKQLDYDGNKCVWDPKYKRNTWSVAKKGSPCMYSKDSVSPIMNMYSFKDFYVEATIGDRGIITQMDILMENDGSLMIHTLNARKCFKDGIENPWFITPENLERSVTTQGNVKWNVYDKITGISITIACVRNSFNDGTFGLPRLDINIDDPVELSKRKRVTGFCVEDKIDKGMSFDNDRTDLIQEKELCSGDHNDERVKFGRQLCGVGTNNKNLDECFTNWCQNKFLDTQLCLDNIESYGMRKVWCSLHTRLDRDPSECDSGGDCLKCLNDIEDNGVKIGMENWESFLQNGDNKCLEFEDLKDSLEKCQEGISIQYFDGGWKTWRVIPQGFSLCDDVDFNSFLFPELFTHKLRLQQCTVPSSCHTGTRCRPEQGFQVTFTFSEPPPMCECPV